MDAFIIAHRSEVLTVLRLAILFMLGWYLGALAARGAKRPPPPFP